MKLAHLFETHEASFDVEEFDLDVKDFIYTTMSVEVFYDEVPPDYIDHEFGRHHLSGYSTFIRAVTTSETVQSDPETDEEIKTWPKGTDVFALPGVSDEKQRWEKYFQNEVDDHYNKDGGDHFEEPADDSR